MNISHFPLFLSLCLSLCLCLLNLDAASSTNHPPISGNADYALSTYSRLGHFMMSELITDFPTDAFTASWWIRINYDPSHRLTEFCMWLTGSHIADQETWLGGIHNLSPIILQSPWNTNVSIPYGVWHHLMFTWKSSTGVLKTYVNLTMINEKVLTETINQTLSNEQWLLLNQETDTIPPGKPFDIQSWSPDATFDEVYIFHEAIEPEFMQQIFDLEVDPNAHNTLVGYWPFNEGSGYVSIDTHRKLNLFLGGGNDHVNFTQSEAPFWTISDVPVKKNRLDAVFYSNKNTLVRIPAYDEDGDSLVFKLLTIPNKINAYQNNNGQVGAKLTNGSQLNTNSFWIVSTEIPTTLRNSTLVFNYSVKDPQVEVPGVLTLHPNTPPMAWNFNIEGEEDTSLIITLFSFDAETSQKNLIIYVDQIPPVGSLFQFLDNSPIKDGDRVNDPEGRVWFVPVANQFGSPYSNVSYHCEDEGGLVAAGVISIILDSVPDPPTTPNMNLVTPEDTPIDLDFSIVTDPDPYGVDHYVIIKYLTSLPEFGKIFRLQNGQEASQVSVLTGPPVDEPSQWISKVVNYSTQWEADYWWKARLLPGPFNCSRGYCDATFYGDCYYAWCPSTADTGFMGTGVEFLEVSFDYPVYVRSFDVYENIGTGTVFKVEARKDGELVPLWNGAATPGLPPVARIFSPQVCHSDWLVDTVKFYLNISAIPGWNEIDAASLSGSLEPNPRGLVTNNVLRYIPDPDWNGDVVFQYQAYDCFGFISTSANITITVTPVNDPPRSGLGNTTMNVILKTENYLELDAFDVENDSMIWFINKLPQFGSLYDIRSVEKNDERSYQESPISQLPYQLRTNRVKYVPNDQNQLDDSFGWSVHDSQGASSEIYTTALNISCAPGYRFESNDEEGEQQRRCVTCSSGTWSESVNSVNCVGCPAAYTSSPGSETCYKDVISPSKFSQRFILAIAIICIICSILLGILLTSLRNKTAIRSATYPLCMVMVLGGIMIMVSALLKTFTDSELVSCQLPPWFLSCGFALALASVLVKNFRLYKIFEVSEVLKVFKVSDTQLVVYSFCATIPNLIILIIWFCLDLPRYDLVKESDHYVDVCQSSEEWIYKGILYGWNGVILMGCLYTAVITRNVSTHFQETRLMAFSIYNVSLCALVIVIIDPLLKPDPSARLIVTQIILLVGVMSTLGTYFFYKIYRAIGSNQAATGSTSPKDSALHASVYATNS